MASRPCSSRPMMCSLVDQSHGKMASFRKRHCFSFCTDKHPSFHNPCGQAEADNEAFSRLQNGSGGVKMPGTCSEPLVLRASVSLHFQRRCFRSDHFLPEVKRKQSSRIWNGKTNGKVTSQMSHLKGALVRKEVAKVLQTHPKRQSAVAPSESHSRRAPFQLGKTIPRRISGYRLRHTQATAWRACLGCFSHGEKAHGRCRIPSEASGQEVWKAQIPEVILVLGDERTVC